MSGSCKRESVEDQEKLINSSIAAVVARQEPLNVSLYCVCSDGDSRRRRALINIALKRKSWLSCGYPIRQTFLITNSQIHWDEQKAFLLPCQHYRSSIWLAETMT